MNYNLISMRNTIRKLAFFGFIGLLLSLIGVWFIYERYPISQGADIDKSRYPVTGIDVSQHSGEIDFQEVLNQNIDFVYMKATEGGDYKDPFFENNYLNAKKHKLPLGTYHLFRYNVLGKTQAQNYLSSLENKSLELPLVADVEEGRPGEKYEREFVIRELKIFIDELYKAGYKNVIIYMNKKNYSIFIDEELEKHQFWIAHLRKEPVDNVNWLFWQHWHNRKMSGVEGFVDLNTFNGSREEWISFLNNEE